MIAAGTRPPRVTQTMAWNGPARGEPPDQRARVAVELVPGDRKGFLRLGLRLRLLKHLRHGLSYRRGTRQRVLQRFSPAWKRVAVEKSGSSRRAQSLRIARETHFICDYDMHIDYRMISDCHCSSRGVSGDGPKAERGWRPAVRLVTAAREVRNRPPGTTTGREELAARLRRKCRRRKRGTQWPKLPGGAPRGARPASWDARRSQAPGVPRHGMSAAAQRHPAPVGAPPTPHRGGTNQTRAQCAAGTRWLFDSEDNRKPAGDSDVRLDCQCTRVRRSRARRIVWRRPHQLMSAGRARNRSARQARRRPRPCASAARGGTGRRAGSPPRRRGNRAAS